MILLGFLCVVSQVHDGDTLTCADRRRVRIAGIEANELRGGCHLPRCAPLSGRRARDQVAAMLVGQRLNCTQVGMSYKRIVATCRLGDRDVGCSIISAGAAAEWPIYRKRYRLGPCR